MRTSLIAAMIVIGGVIAGCGGDDVPTPAATGTTVPTQTQAPTATVQDVEMPALPGVSATDTKLLDGYPGWTELRTLPTGDAAQRGSGAHPGDKRVWAGPATANAAVPYPTGSVVVKEARTNDTITLIAIMEKVREQDAATGGWRYVEYTRPNKDASFAKVAFPESGCANCHGGAKQTDWVFTTK